MWNTPLFHTLPVDVQLVVTWGAGGRWEVQRGWGVGAARVPKTPGKAKRRRLKKRQERERKERQAQQLKAAVERSPPESYFGECC
jgi:hypothetical protein